MSIDYGFKAYLLEHGGSAALDEIVHDAANQLASSTNNDGLDFQVEFLTTTCGWSEEDIKQALEGSES